MPAALLAALLAAPALADDPGQPDPMERLRGPHGADAPDPVRRQDTWDLHGELRGRVDLRTDPPLDPEGAVSGGGWWLSSRLIVGVDWRPTDRLQVALELEAMNGRFAGPPVLTGTAYSDEVFRLRRADSRDLLRVLPRRLGVAYADPGIGQVRVGVEPFTWGTGMLANDGAGDPDFGDPNTGSLVARLGFSTAPWRFRDGATDAARGTVFFVSLDTVLRDDNAALLDGDTAIQGVLGFRLGHPVIDVGAFGVARWQRDRQDPLDPREGRTTVTAFPIDLYLKALLTPRRLTDQRVVLEAEAVLVHGTSDRPYLDETQAGVRVQGVGAVGRLRYDHDRLRLSVRSEIGLASGDDDPRDDVARSFAFHSDYNVGMLLFEHVLPLLTAHALDRAADPALVAVPSPGGRFTVNQGVVTNAVYLNGVIRYRPLPDLELRLGHLQAWAPGDVVDVYQSARNGGYNTTSGGQVGGGRSYGHELDLAIRYTARLPHRLAFDLGLEGAVLLPGDAFDGLGGGALPTQGLGRGRLAFRW
ncbi:MAG: hypothetical protein H6732_17850 [Alphaproteobacteria bacterium]|nr:hypothetical protein [Alphaproteobacteria bacterium]